MMKDNDNSIQVWAENEFGKVEIGDKRRTRRLVRTAAGKAANPEAAMTLCCERGDAQGICRLFDREEVTFEAVTSAHRNRTYERCSAYKNIFAVQDTTCLDFTSHKALEGLGRICHNSSGFGLLMHATIAVTPDRTPLGILDANIWAREKVLGKKPKASERRIEEKESFKWLRGKDKAAELLPDSCNVVVVCDRESDIFELFASPRPDNVDLLVRASQNRSVRTFEPNGTERERLFDVMKKADSLGGYKLKVPARPGRKSRTALMEVRSGTIEIYPHKSLRNQGYSEPVRLNWVWTVEKKSSSSKQCLDWKLLTTLPVSTLDEARECIDGYSNRWIIEEYYRVLKSGCKIEGLQFETLDRMYPAMAVCCVVAWRVLFLSKYARENPGGDAELVSTVTERKVLLAWLKSHKTRKRKIRTVKDFVFGVARLGGFPGRKSDGYPGPKTIWQGLRRLEDLVAGYNLAQQMQ